MANPFGPIMGSPIGTAAFTVQDGGDNPLSAVPTSALAAGQVVGVKDMGGCGGDNLPGFGLALWTGTEWRRISRGVQATRPDAGTIQLDYWKDPTRIKLTAGAAPRVLLTNSRIGHLVTLYRDGILSTLQAFSINLGGGALASDLKAMGSALASFEVISDNTITSVQA